MDQITNERTQTHVKSNPWWKPKNWVKCPWQHLILTASILCFNKLHNRVQFSCWFTKKWCQQWADIISLWTFLSYFIISFIHDDTGWLTFLFNSRANRIQIMYQGKNNYWKIKQISNADYINTITKNSIPFWVNFPQKLQAFMASCKTLGGCTGYSRSTKRPSSSLPLCSPAKRHNAAFCTCAQGHCSFILFYYLIPLNVQLQTFDDINTTYSHKLLVNMLSICYGPSLQKEQSP